MHSRLPICRDVAPDRRDALLEAAPAHVTEFVVLPRPAAIVVLSDLVSLRREMLEDLRRRFGLTKAEGDVALELLNGDGRAATAERLGITLSTCGRT